MKINFIQVLVLAMVDTDSSGQDGNELSEQGVSAFKVKSQICDPQSANDVRSIPFSSHLKY